ncbi:MAG: MinD/ParA family protein [Desulfobacterales bacterium]|nr:MinD/ParA family protein [Desulfobacterales bacterium]MCP4163330.1 MinD/ParA family protein [Deltaproteobacteria bacterium]
MDQASSLRKIVRKESQDLKKKNNKGKKSSEDPRVISVTSGKGGVGKTNMVGNLAIAFTKLNKNVLIIDADLGLANIDIIFGIKPKYNIGHVLNGEQKLEDVIVEIENGIKIIPAGSGFANLTELSEIQKMNLLTEFESLDAELDVVLIDTGAGISSNVLYFNLAADECLVVATGEPTSMTDAYATIKVMYTQHGVKYFKLLVNMVKDEEEAKYVYSTLSQAMDQFLSGVLLEYIGFVPSDEKLAKAVVSRKPVMELHPDAASSKKVMEIAESLLKSPKRRESDGNIKFFLNRFIDYRVTE